MKYLSIVLKEISIQVLWGFAIGTVIVMMNLFHDHEDIKNLSNKLFIVGVILLLVLPIILRPKGMRVRPRRDISFGAWKFHLLTGPVKEYPQVEPSDDESLLGLSREEQKIRLALEGYVIFVKMFGIGLTLILYSLTFYLLFGNQPAS